MLILIKIRLDTHQAGDFIVEKQTCRCSMIEDGASGSKK